MYKNSIKHSYEIYEILLLSQHGKDECFLDVVEACAINAWPDLNGHFPFIYCVESLVYHRNYTQWETCFEKLNLKKKPVIECVGSGRGKEDYEDFISYICKAYKGTTPVPGCSSSINVIKMGRKLNSFCLKQTAISKLSTISSAITSWLNRAKLTASA
ncbi:hypothetical protein BC332_14791 [Capsicum chinense]|nr:hypothetical protein BC332_14791 [Capsicum chinense]